MRDFLRQWHFIVSTDFGMHTAFFAFLLSFLLFFFLYQSPQLHVPAHSHIHIFALVHAANSFAHFFFFLANRSLSFKWLPSPVTNKTNIVFFHFVNGIVVRAKPPRPPSPLPNTVQQQYNQIALLSHHFLCLNLLHFIFLPFKNQFCA